MTETTTPISMRFNDTAIEQLKGHARKLSFERNKDLSYVDLIREAVDQRYNLSLSVIDEIADFSMDELSESREFWTPEQVEAFNKTPIGQLVIKCVQEESYGDFVKLMKQKLSDWVLSRSIANKVLYQTAGQNGRLVIERDLGAVAHVVLRRGAVPDQIIEGEEIPVPSFDICSYPTMKMREIKPHLMFDMLIKSIMAVQKELDSNIFNALRAAADSRNQIISTEYFTPDTILRAFKQIAQHYLVPNSIIMHSHKYLDMSMFSKEFLNAPPLREALETKQYGSIQGVSVIVNNRCDPNTVYVTAKPKSVGAFLLPSLPVIRHQTDTAKQRETFAITLSCGIGISNDYAISRIDVGKKQPA